jgi:cytidyltransferase-like protein
VTGKHRTPYFVYPKCAEANGSCTLRLVVVAFDELQRYRGLVAMVDGAFDPLHAGHIAYFRLARTIWPTLLCNVASDAYVREKHPVLLPEAQRVTVVDALRDINYTHLNEHTTEDVLKQLRPLAYIKGSDWRGRLPARQVDICRQYGIRLLFLETVTESSSRLLRAVGSFT